MPHPATKYMATLFLLLIAQFCGWHAAVELPEAIPGQQAPQHAAWDTLLRKHVQENGLVDYRGFLKDRRALEGYLEMLGNHIPGDSWGKEEKLAYYINLYNAATILLILDNYPLKSIKDIWNPWGKNRIQIGPASYSLNDIEHGILRKMDEPRIHFAVNCASYSCPVLLREAYTSENLDAQLDQAARGFINDPARNRTKRGEAELSRIFKWYKGDFARGDKTLLDYINRYLDQPLPEGTEIDYLTYDWRLNDTP